MSIVMNLKKLDHYRRAVLTVLPISFAFLLYLILMHGSSILFSHWFIDFIFIPAFVGNLISGSSYIARTLDMFNPGQNTRPAKMGEKIGTTIGLISGLSVGITATALHASILLTDSLGGLANAILVVNQIANYGGFGNRLGSSIDQGKLPNEIKAIGLSTLIGLGVGIALVVTAKASLICIMGVTTFFTGGAALPLWLGAILFVGSFSSTLVSFSDYCTKGFNFIKSNFRTVEPNLKQRIQDRFHEYRGSCVGITIGFAVAAMVITALAVTQPHIFFGLVGIVKAATIFVTAVGVLGGMCSRVGRLLDGFTNKEKIITKEPPEIKKPLLAPPSPKNQKDILVRFKSNPPSPKKTPELLPESQTSLMKLNLRILISKKTHLLK